MVLKRRNHGYRAATGRGASVRDVLEDSAHLASRGAAALLMEEDTISMTLK
jgi:hypothetical protein